eukprot:scaffold3255_cov191-Ochromonas_danica.AAC.5
MRATTNGRGALTIMISPIAWKKDSTSMSSGGGSGHGGKGGGKGGQSKGGSGAGHGMAATLEKHDVKAASSLPSAECARGKGNTPGAPSGTGNPDKGSRANYPPREEN